MSSVLPVVGALKDQPKDQHDKTSYDQHVPKVDIVALDHVSHDVLRSLMEASIVPILRD